MLRVVNCFDDPVRTLPVRAGSEMMALISELYPICRSVTGDGVRRTLEIIRRTLPLEIREVPSGTPVFDWTVPREWNVKDAYVANSRGERVIDFRKSNLHLVSSSMPVRARMTLDKLRPRLHTLPEHPEWIPYQASFYKEDWGFCLSHRDYLALEEGEYEVVIDSSFTDGSLSYGELYLDGEEPDEVLLTAHVCHPSLCNDNLSGIAVLASVAGSLMGVRRRFSYRILFIPATIGAIAWLARNRDRLARIRHGLVLAGLGDRGAISYKKSRRGNAEIDRTVAQILRDSGAEHRILEFSPSGYDERQFCAPGFDLPVGRFARSVYGTYPEYHTSADNMDFVSAEHLADSHATLVRILAALEGNETFVNLSPYGEPQLGKRGLYAGTEEARLAILWVLNLSDGRHSLLDIAERSSLRFAALREAANVLLGAGLLERRG